VSLGTVDALEDNVQALRLAKAKVAKSAHVIVDSATKKEWVKLITNTMKPRERTFDYVVLTRSRGEQLWQCKMQGGLVREGS